MEDLFFFILLVLKGYIFGGGCECVFVIDFWIGDVIISIGLFEIKLGIMLGFGGIVCLLCLIGVDSVMEIII